MYKRIFMKLKRLAVDNIHVHIKRIKLIEYVLCISIFQRHLCILDYNLRRRTCKLLEFAYEPLVNFKIK